MPATDAVGASVADDYCTMPAANMAAEIRARRLSPVEVVDAVLQRIDRLNPMVNAYCLVIDDQARTAAEAAEQAVISDEPLGALHGVPFSLKDLTYTARLRTTFGSKLFADHVPAVDAVIVERLRAAGGILIGKTNTPDHGCKGVTDNLLFGATSNPWETTRTSGGSSGGAAAAVATGMAPIAEGSDFAGSVRIPAAHCGVVGFKPSDGRIPNFPDPMPLHPVAFNHGPLARTVADCALMLDVMSGPDERDPRTLPSEQSTYSDGIRDTSSVQGLHIGWLGNLGFAALDDEVDGLARSAAGRFEERSCVLEPVDEDFSDAVEAYSLLNANRRAATLEAYLETNRDDMDQLMPARIEFATSRTAADAARAEIVQTQTYHRIRSLFERYDLLMLPTVPCPAFELGRNFPEYIGDDRIESPFDIIPLTFIFNLTGHPAISLPAGWTMDGLPVGLQIVGPWRADAQVLRAAAAFEELAPWSHRWPPMVNSVQQPP